MPISSTNSLSVTVAEWAVQQSRESANASGIHWLVPLPWGVQATTLACEGSATADRSRPPTDASCMVTASMTMTLAEGGCTCVQVRPGLPEGTQFVFDKEGDVGPKNKAGPVMYVLKAQQHPRFTCKGSDLLYTAQIPLYQALCGTALPVDTLDGRQAAFSRVRSYTASKMFALATWSTLEDMLQ